MKKLHQSKRGFTLTELAIVIAVIAILIAVLVPTFVSLINKANESSDVQTVRNMNTILSTETDGIEKPTDALQLVYEEGGYSVANMTPRSNGKIVYDELTTSFVYVYTDGSTYPENSSTVLTAYTTWELVSASDIEANADGEYRFDKSTYASNSVILTGSDWAGKTVYASYGVELWNDSDTSAALSSLYVVNTDSSVQTADTGSISLAKSAIKTTESANGASNIIVNVRTSYLSYAADVYNISDHSKVSTLLSASGKGTYYQYGTTNGYDITNSGSSNIVVCNKEQAEKINKKEVAIITTDGDSVSDCISDSTGTVEVDFDDYEATIVVTLDEGATLQISITEEGTVTITAGKLVITVEKDTTLTEVANDTGLGTADFPYLVATLEELTDKIASDCCIQLTDDIECSTAIEIDANITLDLNGHTISATSTSIHTIKLGWTNSAATLTIKDKSETKAGAIINIATSVYSAISSKGNLVLESGTIEAKSKGISNLNGTLTINGGTVKISGATYNYSTLTNTVCAIFNNGGTTTINGGTIEVSSDITTLTYTIIMYKGDLVVNDGSKIIGGYGVNGGTKSAAIATLNTNVTSITINGGTIESGLYGIYFNAQSGKASTLTINDGTITTTSIGICLVATGTVTLNGGSITSNEGSAVTTSTASSAGKFIINGGTIKGYTYAINNASSNSNVVEINGGTLIGNTAGVSLNTSSTVTGGQYSDTSASENVTAGYILSSEVNSNGYYEVTKEEVTE